MQQEALRRRRFLLLALSPLYFLIISFFIQPFDEILQGLVAIVESPDFLITDYFVVGGPGAALFNASVSTLLCILIIYLLGMEFDGHTITSTALLFGFSLFGKNILNIWTIMLGVCLYARFHRVSITKYLYVGLYGTSLSPIITQIMHIDTLPVPVRLLLSGATGLLIGFILPPLSTHTYYAHKGYSLYNVGLACGIIATVVVSLFRSFDITIHSRLIWATDYDLLFGSILLGLFAVWIILPLVLHRQEVLVGYRMLLQTSGTSHTDYFKAFGPACVYFNMGINGTVATLLLLAVGGDINGPTIGGIFTIVGFSATGKHIRNILPIMAGVYLGSLTKNWSITDPSCTLAFLFSTTLAPIAGEFGVIAGIIAGYLHSSVALNVGMINSGMNLYNNGFAGGLVAIILVPVIQSFISRRARANSDISL